MTCLAGGWEVRGNMIRVGCGVEICQVTSYARVGSIDVATLVARKAIVGNHCMGTGKRVNSTMIERRGRPSRR